MSNFSFEIFGNSHDPEIGIKIVGLPQGTKIREESVFDMLKRRGASSAPWSTPRKEEDKVEFTLGVEDGVVVGDVTAVIRNMNTRSGDYGNLNTVPRPSHADYPSYVKYGKIFPGGGKWSGRMTAPLCILGAIAKDILREKGIEIGAYVSSIGSVFGRSYKEGEVSLLEIENCHKKALPTLSNEREMVEEVLRAKGDCDSVGGTVECIVYGLPIGLGDSFSEGMESAVAHLVYGVPGVKGVEFGAGFDISKMRGSDANDQLAVRDGKVVTLTNNSGGINGGMTNGMPLTLRVALRPTPSIFKEQNSVDLVDNSEVKLSIKGRHDACIVPRAVAGIESAVAIAVLGKIL